MNTALLDPVNIPPASAPVVHSLKSSWTLRGIRAHLGLKSTERDVLLALIYFAGPSGIWPSVETLAAHVDLGVRMTQRYLRRLERFGIIRIVLHGGKAPDRHQTRQANSYEIVPMTCPPTCDGSSNHNTRRVSSRPPGYSRARGARRPPGRTVEPSRMIPRSAPKWAFKTVAECPPIPVDTWPVVVTLLTPEEKLLRTQINPKSPNLKPENAVLNRESSTPTAEICPRWTISGQPHAFSPKTGRCIDCDAAPAWLVTDLEESFTPRHRIASDSPPSNDVYRARRALRRRLSR